MAAKPDIVEVPEVKVSIDLLFRLVEDAGRLHWHHGGAQTTFDERWQLRDRIDKIRGRR